MRQYVKCIASYFRFVLRAAKVSLPESGGVVRGGDIREAVRV